MNKLLVVLALAVCSYALKLSNNFPTVGVENRKRGDVVFTPHKLPCSYDAKLMTSQTKPFRDEVEEHIMLSSMEYFKLTSKYSNNTESVTLLRTDVSKQEGDKKYSLLAGWSTLDTQTGTCDEEYVENPMVAFILAVYAGVFSMEQTFDNVTNGTFDGKSVSIYESYNDFSEEYSYLYADSDNYIVGLKTVSENKETVTKVSFRSPVGRDEFIIDDKSKHAGCNGQVYKSPETAACSASSESASLILIFATLLVALLSILY